MPNIPLDHGLGYKIMLRDRGRAGGIPLFWGIASKKACLGAKCLTEGG